MPEQTLRVFLQQQLSTSPEVKRLVLGFSGGLDSTVLLQALVNIAPEFQRPLLAVHVHHGLSPNADAWAEHVSALCERHQLPLHIHHVQVTATASIEAAARDARCAAFAQSLQAGDALLLAQHQDDQAETVLFRLLRGAGVRGLGAMHATSVFPGVFPLEADVFIPCWRPFLSISRQALEHYARAQALQWIEDESNQDTRYARNFLRQDIIPRLQTQWPMLTQTLAATARRLQEADSVLDELAAEMAQACIDSRRRLFIPAFMALSPARQHLLLRYWLRQQTLPLPSAVVLEKIKYEVIAAREDAAPCLMWSGCEIRRYREHVYAMSPLTPAPVSAQWQCEWDGKTALRLPDGKTLQIEAGYDVMAEQGFLVRYRRGGEHFRASEDSPSRELKNIFQEEGVPPWERERMPLIFKGGGLIAVAGLEKYATGFSLKKI
jgi:tRNA(Ile)-lysidine synthase